MVNFMISPLSLLWDNQDPTTESELDIYNGIRLSNDVFDRSLSFDGGMIDHFKEVAEHVDVFYVLVFARGFDKIPSILNKQCNQLNDGCEEYFGSNLYEAITYAPMRYYYGSCLLLGQILSHEILFKWCELIKDIQSNNLVSSFEFDRIVTAMRWQLENRVERSVKFELELKGLIP